MGRVEKGCVDLSNLFVSSTQEQCRNRMQSGLEWVAEGCRFSSMGFC